MTVANFYAAPGRCSDCGRHLRTIGTDATVGQCVNPQCTAHETWQDIPRVWKFGRVRSGLTRVAAERL